MQQRLAVASVLVLVLLAGTSAVLIFQSHASGQAQPNGTSQSTNTGATSTTTTSSTNSTGSSLLTNGNHTQTYHDDGIETHHTSTNSTMMDE
jgi:cytoskeletal protein RodZ